jgi:hypothetical protein
MNPVDPSLQKLLDAAAQAPREPAPPPPFSTEAAVIARMRSATPEEDEFAPLVALFRYATAFGLVMVLLSGAWNYFEDRSNPGATALASYAMTQLPP